MKKIKILSLTALAGFTIGVTALSSCSGDDGLSQAQLDELARTIIMENDGAKVSNDFKVPSYVSNGKDVVKIEWHSNNENLLTFKYVEDDVDTKDIDESLEDATAVVVLPTDQLTEVTYYATLTSGSTTATSETFRVRIEKAISAEETFKKFYDTCAEKNTMDIAGYVQVKAGKSVYNSKEQCSLFIQEENGYGGFFAYNCYLSAAEYDALKVGDYVKVTGQTSSVYNGIYEACYGDVEVDSTKKNAEVANKVVDLTADLKAGNDILYKQNQIAKVEGAVVSSITASDKFISTSGKYLSTMQNVLKVTIGDAEYSVVLMEGVTPFADAATKTLFDAIIGKVSVADSVNIKGVICGTAFIVSSADDVTVAQAGELTDEQKAELKLSTLKINETVDGVEAVELFDIGNGMEYKLNADAKAATITSDGYLYIVPTEKDETITLTVNATVGTATKSKTFTVLVKGYEGKVKTIAEVLELEKGTYVYVSGTITKYYEFKDAVSGIFIKDASGETEYQVFRLYDHKDKYAADAYPAIGSTVVLYGKVDEYNGTKQLASSKVVLLQEAELTDDQKAEAFLTAEAKKFAASYSADATVTLSEGVTATVKEGTTATTVVVSGSTVTITPADTKEDVVLVLSYTLNGKAYTKEVTLSTQKAVVPTDSILVVTPENFATATLTLDKVVENTSYPEEFTIKAGGSICGTVTGNFTTIVAYIFGTHDNMKMYAGTSADGTLITATTATGENGVIYTYTMPADAKSFYFVNSSTYNVQVFSLSINGSGDLVVSDETKANTVLTAEAAKFDAKYPANATVTLSEGVTAAVKEGTTATTVAISGSTVTITPTATKEEVVLVLSYTLNGQAYTKEVAFSTELPASGATVANVTYNAPADTVEIVWGTEVSSFFTFPAGVVASAVVNQGSNSGSSTKFYSYSARIYKGSELVITAAEGYTFSALEITYDGDNYGNGVITISEDGKTITISASNNQIRIKAMTLSYVAE